MSWLLWPIRLIARIIFSIFGLARRRQVFRSEKSRIDVVGESHYAEALWGIVGRPRGDDGPTWEGLAVLKPEPSNRHDKNAVLVLINGRVVGHLDRTLARRLQPALIALARRRVEVAVPCHTKGGFKLDRGERADLGIVLRFEPKDVLKAAD